MIISLAACLRITGLAALFFLFYVLLDELTQAYYAFRARTIKDSYATWGEYVPYLLPAGLLFWGALTGDDLPRNMALMAVLGIYFLQKNNKAALQKAIRREIVDVVDYLVIADEAEIDFGEVLYLASQTTRSPRLAHELRRASAEYSMTKDMVSAAQGLANRLGMEEAAYLPLAAEQIEKTGSAGYMLEMLSETLHAKRNAETYALDKGNDYKVIAAAFLLVAGLFSLYFVPLFNSAQTGLSSIFR